VIDLSTRGVLVEAGRPLRPGSRVEVHLESDTNRTLVAARVLRCSVAALHSESGVTYRAALAFNEICEWLRECETPGESDLPGHGSDAALAEAIAGESIPVLQVALIDPIALGSE
jgi:hypothetical protein